MSTEQFHGAQRKMQEKTLNFIADIPELLIRRHLPARSAFSTCVTSDFPRGGVPGSLLISEVWHHQLRGAAVV